MIKVGINGFGRIGRFVFRAAQVSVVSAVSYSVQLRLVTTFRS